MLDSTVVALALPEIRGDVGASSEGLQWVMNAYLLTIAVLVVSAGRLGDMFGRKRVFIAGMVVFAIGSVVSGAAADQVGLIVGRGLQGAGGAPMLSLFPALVWHALPSAGALALPVSGLQRLPLRGAAAGAGDLGGGLGGGARHRAPGRRRPDRNRLAGYFFGETAGGGAWAFADSQSRA